jgi:hypothetical protein
MSWVVFYSLTVEDEEGVLSARVRERLGGLEVSTLQRKNLTAMGFFIISCYTLGGYGI